MSSKKNKNVTFSNTNPKEVKDKTFTNCAGDLLEVNGTKILTTKSGDPVVSVPTTGNQDYDSHKGLMFYPNNRVFLGDQSKRGTWGCNGSNVAVQAEQLQVCQVLIWELVC